MGNFLINHTDHFIYLPVAGKTPLAALFSDVLTRSIPKLNSLPDGSLERCLVAGAESDEHRAAFTDGFKTLLSELAHDLKMPSPYSLPITCVVGITEGETIHTYYGTVAFIKIEEGILCSFTVHPIKDDEQIGKTSGRELIDVFRSVMSSRNIIDRAISNRVSANPPASSSVNQNGQLPSITAVSDIFETAIRNERDRSAVTAHREWEIDYVIDNGISWDISNSKDVSTIEEFLALEHSRMSAYRHMADDTTKGGDLA